MDNKHECECNNQKCDCSNDDNKETKENNDNRLNINFTRDNSGNVYVSLENSVTKMIIPVVNFVRIAKKAAQAQVMETMKNKKIITPN